MLIANGQDPDHFEPWNAELLRLGPEFFNFMSTHFVVNTGDVMKANASAEFTAQAGLALPVGLERQLRAMKQQIDSDTRARERVKIAFTEWLYSGTRTRAATYDNLGGALCAAGFLNTLMRVADFTPIADMTGLIEFGGIWQKRGRVYGVPAYWAFRMYSTADGTRLVDTRTQVEQYDVQEGVRRIPNIQGVPYLDVVAALNDAGDKLTLFCVNRHLTRDIRASVRLSGFAPASARGSQLTAASLTAMNSEETPEAIVPKPVTLAVEGSRLEQVFPHLSITVIELAGAR
jgi:alpha-N-arabinofuranosidase